MFYFRHSLQGILIYAVSAIVMVGRVQYDNFSSCMELLKCMVVVHVHGAWSTVHW